MIGDPERLLPQAIDMVSIFLIRRHLATISGLQQAPSKDGTLSVVTSQLEGRPLVA